MVWYTTPHWSLETMIEGGSVPASHADVAPRLLVILGRVPGKVFPILYGDQWLGRDADCSIHLIDASVAGHHARITRNQDGSVHISDICSPDGVRVNDRKISETALNNGDIIRVGNVIMKFYEPGTIEAEVFQRVFQMALTDSLTETLSKAAIVYHLERMLESEPQGVSVIMADLDHFKQINDTYGHVNGDYVLKQVALILRDGVLNESELVGRFGGEEFLIVLAEGQTDRARELAEKLRQSIANEKILLPNQQKEISLTCSFGVAHWQPSDAELKDPVEALLSRADQALYKAKHEGRNRVCQ